MREKPGTLTCSAIPGPRSVLAIGGIGGLAIGLAGREICENILNGFLIMTTVRGGASAWLLFGFRV
jgi:hypothetical protein